MGISYKKYVYISLGICTALIFSLAVASLIADHIFSGLNILSKAGFTSKEVEETEALEFGIVDRKMPNVRLEIPVGYFYHLHGGREGWDTVKRRRSHGDSIVIMMTLDGLMPFSQENEQLFFSHENRNYTGNIIYLMIKDRAIYPYINNKEYISNTNLRKINSEYYGLDKYIASPNRFIYLNGDSVDDYEIYICRTDTVDCTVMDSRGDFTIYYFLPRKK